MRNDDVGLALDRLAQAIARGAILEGLNEITRRHEQKFSRRLIARRKAAVLDSIARHQYRTAAARRADLQAVETLMRPLGNRDSHRRKIRHEAAAIVVPLGATTGQRTPQQPTPVFPVHIRKLDA